MGRAPCCSKDAGLNRGAWTAEEDMILTDYIAVHADGGWGSLPKKAGLKRCGKSCRLRWLNYLRPDIKRGNISSDEEELIIRLHELLGNRWSLIAGRLPGRTDNEIKNYWNTRLCKKLPNTGRSTAPETQNFNAKSKSPSHLEDHADKFKVIPVKTTAMRIVKGLNKRVSNANPSSDPQDLKYPSDATDIMNASKSWCELLVDELITDTHIEFVDFSARNNFVEPESSYMEVIGQYPSMSNLIDQKFLPSAEDGVSTCKMFPSSPHCNLLSSPFNSLKDFTVEEFKAKSTNDFKQIYSDFHSDIQQVKSFTVSDEKEICNNTHHVDWVGEFQCLQMPSNDSVGLLEEDWA